MDPGARSPEVRSVVDEIRSSALDLCLSLWSELGARGGPRNHQDVAIDPEQLIAFTGCFADDDPELDDHVSQWCAENNRYLSEARLRHFEHDFGWRRHGPVGRAFGRTRATKLDLARPGALSLRLRAVFGTGARAEVIGFLLACRGSPIPIRWMQDEIGYAPASIKDALRRLSDGGLVCAARGASAATYALERPSHLAALVEPLPKAFVRWRALFGFLRCAIEDFPMQEPHDPFAKVFFVESLDRFSGMAGIGSPRSAPSLRLEDVVGWLRETVGSVAGGDHHIFGARER